jgi:hypothetical protein
LGKRSLHCSPPPPLSVVVGVSNQMDDEVPILYGENYSPWRIEMKVPLKEMGAGIWKEAISGSVCLKNKSKFSAQREGKKNDALALNTIISGLSSPIKESMGQCTTAKDIWLKIEETYQRKNKAIEDNSIKTNEGKISPKTLGCIISKYDDVGKKEDLEDISNEGKESCDDVDKREDLEDISNEGKESCDDVDKMEYLEDI